MAIVMFGVLLAPSAFGQESGDDLSGADQTAETTDFRLVPHAGVSGSIASVHVVPGLAFRYQPGLFGIGTDVKVYQGLYPLETYPAAHALIHIGAFYLGGGGSFPLAYPQGENDDNDDQYYFYTPQLMPSIALGTMFRFDKDAQSSLGMRIGLEWTFTGYLMELEEEPENLGEAIGLGIGAGIAGALIAVMNGVKLNVGMTYSYGF
jgi:hypothetical protein